MKLPEFKPFSRFVKKDQPQEQKAPGYDQIKESFEKGGDIVSLAKEALSQKVISEKQYGELMGLVASQGQHVVEWLNKGLDKSESTIDKLRIDPVTGIEKFDSLKEKLGNYLAELNFNNDSEQRRVPTLSSIVVIAFDLDNLKKWNDISHDAGDQALRTIADLLFKEKREGDLLFRRGDKSDEIVMVLRIDKDLSDEQIKNIFKEKQQGVNSGTVEVAGKGRLPVTAAAGYFIVRPGDKKSLEDILNEADKAQVHDKEPEVKELRINTATQNIK